MDTCLFTREIKMAGLTGSEEVFNSAHTVAEREASIGNAKNKAAMLTTIGVSSSQIDGLAGAVSASAANVLATMENVPDEIEFGSTGGTACEGNDARLPTSDQKSALIGTAGTPSASNPYVTADDARMGKADTAVQPTGTPVANQIAYWTTAQILAASTVTTTELEALTGIEGNVQDQIDAEIAARIAGDEAVEDQLGAEASARLAADLALLASQPTIRAITYKGGLSAFAASAARVVWLDYGGAVMMRVCAFGNGTLAEMAPLALSLTDSDGSAARVQVSLTLDTGTLVMQTTARALPLSAWRRLGVRVDAPSGGALSSASVTLHIEGVTHTLANGSLYIDSADYSGAPAAGTGNWTLCANADGTNALSARVASDGWHALNYALSADDYALRLSTGKLPHAGVGTMGWGPSRSCWAYGALDNDFADPASKYFAKYACTVAATSAARTGGAGAYCLTATVPNATSYIDLSFYLPPRPVGSTTKVTCWLRCNSSTVSSINLRLGESAHVGSASNTVTVVPTGDWQFVEADLVSTLSLAPVLRIYTLAPTAGDTVDIDDLKIILPGDFCAGLDLAAQPLCTRTAGGAVLLHSASGVEGFDAPERMTLATQTNMTASGYLLGDRLVHPAGYIVERVLVTNMGSASATVTLRAGSSGGAAMATGTVAATGLPVALPLSSISSLTATGGKIYVTGAATSSPLTITVILARA